MNCLAQCFTKLSTSFKLQAPECDTAEFDKDSSNIRDWCSENKLFSVKSQENQTIVSDLTTTKPMVFRN